MVDLGYLDEETLWKVLEEQKRTGSDVLGKRNKEADDARRASLREAMERARRERRSFDQEHMI